MKHSPHPPGLAGISSIEDAERLLGTETGPAPDLWSPAGAAAIHGVLWFLMLQRAIDDAFPDSQATIVLDCGERADLAVEALRLGLRAVALDAPRPVRAKVAAIAAGCGARLLDRPAATPVD